MFGREKAIFRGMICVMLAALLGAGCGDGETSWVFVNDNGVKEDVEDPLFTLDGVFFGQPLTEETDGLASLPFDEVGEVPRNAALVLEFTRPVDPGCLNLDDQGCLSVASPIQLVTEAGTPLPAKAFCREGRVVLIPTSPLPPGPLFFDDQWNSTSHPTGYLKLFVLSAGTGPDLLRSTSATSLSARKDLAGTPCKPIGINAGPGFFPTSTTPRIIREVRDAGTAALGSDAFTIKDPSKNFVTLANNGAGEWAGAWLFLRPGEPTEEKGEVDHNSTDTIYIKGSFINPPVPGTDGYAVARSEYFEPIPGVLDPSTAVDPVNHPKDPYDPQDEKNWDLAQFAQFSEWDEVAGKWIPVSHVPGTAVHPSWRISLRFSEPMDLDSLRTYETFFICHGDGPAFERMKPGRVTGEDRNRLISFEPVVIDPAGADRLVGFGGMEKRLKLVLRTVPSEQDLDDFYSSLGPVGTWPEEVVEDLVKTGVKGIVSEGGQPLGYPAQLLDVGSEYCVIYPGSPGRGAFPPALDLTFRFHTLPADPEKNPETGALVHRFMGFATPAMGGTPLIHGVTYFDHPGLIYGPHIYDTSVGLNGFLSGHFVEFIQKVFDDYNHPDPTSPHYPDPLVKIPFGVGTPVTSGYGVRFQHVYRNGDVSPDAYVMAGSVLDLLGAAWAPIGGEVVNTVIEKMALAVSHSDIVPNSGAHGGIPDQKNSGLRRYFEENIAGHERRFVSGDENNGVPYVINKSNLFKPKNAGSAFNMYLPLPGFSRSVPYNAAHSMLFEYRLDPNTGTAVSPMNGFSFCPAIMTSMLPRFRAYSRGDALNPVYAASKPNDYPLAWGPLPAPGTYGDNSRYFMLFDYVKRVSTVVSPHLGRAVKTAEQRFDFLTPLIDPPLSEIPAGTALDLMFQVSFNPHSPAGPEVPWVEAEEVEKMNEGAFAGYDFIRFRSIFEANIDNGAIPVLDSIVVPYLILER